jgi:hypothetical protein
MNTNTNEAGAITRHPETRTGVKSRLSSEIQSGNSRAGRLGAIGSLALLAVCLAALAFTPGAQAAGGNVLPPTATPLGWSIDDMGAAIANFSASGNDPAYYPDTPFQIIYRHPGNGFTVKPGTFFFVKVFYIDDSPPIIGDWPADKSAAANYVFGRTELGAHDLQIEVDGKVFSLDDPGYIGGPVLTPDSPSGSDHLIQVGAYLTPMSKGTHHVTIRGVLDGDAMVAILGGPWAVEIPFTVIVQ